MTALGSNPQPTRTPPRDHASEDALLRRIREGIIGAEASIEGPFGPKPMVYADHAASGRSLSFIEHFIESRVLPHYANTHTETSSTGFQSTQLREEARRTIHACVGGGPDDIVIFAGTGATGAIDLILAALNIYIPQDLDRAHGLSEHIPAEQRPVVFVGPYEHHANEVPWRLSLADVVRIPEREGGGVCLDALEQALARYADRPLKIGSFSAASNVTGILCDDLAITETLHRHGALSFWDYAAAGPYVDIAMNPTREGVDAKLLTKDAVFISTHKLVGGPSTPGVLVVKRRVLRNTVPHVPAGGTVSYVSRSGQDFLEDPAHREEGGTPDVVGSIRAGLVFALKAQVGPERIRAHEVEVARRFISTWSTHPGIWVLGELEAERLAILSFAIHHGEGMLHWSFVVALLNDLFGIQARGGCSCAGPYGHDLFGIDQETSESYRKAIRDGYEGVKPGWARVSLSYFMSEEELSFIERAVVLVAELGHRMLPHYHFEPRSGRWTHRQRPLEARVSLSDFSFDAPAAALTKVPRDFERVLAEARELMLADQPAPPERVVLPDDIEKLRWFPLD